MLRSTPQILGEFEQVVLLAIMRLEDGAYGVTIRKEIRECTGRNATPGALYNTLDRLEEKGMVRSHFGDPSPQRGGRAKRLFNATLQGIEAVAHAQRGYQRLMRSLRIPGISHA
jgi:DNA-binding PadR family transcriptional regulator